MEMKKFEIEIWGDNENCKRIPILSYGFKISFAKEIRCHQNFEVLTVVENACN